jgi:hypothetical protein
MTSENRFVELAAIDVSKYVEKKQNLSYLSWAWAVDQLLRRDPDATWDYADPVRFGGETMMVFCTVTAFGKPKKAQLPVMDHRNKAIPNPDAFAVNTAMQRCLVKAIAMHGLGLYIYAGEDVPRSEEPERPVSVLERIQATDPGNARKATTDAFASLPEEAQQVTREWAMEVVAHLNDGDVAAAFDFIELQDMDSEGKMALWSLLDSKARSAIKKEQERRRIAGVKKVPMPGGVGPGTKAMFDEMHRRQEQESKPHISEQA